MIYFLFGTAVFSPLSLLAQGCIFGHLLVVAYPQFDHGHEKLGRVVRFVISFCSAALLGSASTVFAIFVVVKIYPPDNLEIKIPLIVAVGTVLLFIATSTTSYFLSKRLLRCR